MSKRIVQNAIFLAIIVLISFSFAFHKGIKPEIRKYKIRTVVIDAGHGGHDPGALSPSKNTKEKDITLPVALELGETIKKYMPEVKVIFTRNSDKFVELYKRAQVANENDADVFISIHCNAMDVKKNKKSAETKGMEVYVMGTHVSKENLDVAKRENEVILLETGYKKNYKGFDPNSPQAYITLTSIQNNYLENSLRLSMLIDKQFTERLNRQSRGVKQAGFLVLREIASTSILVELGYLSNSEEETYLKDPWNQTLMASAIFRAFRDYKNEVEK
ncbi:MAG: N-acetylmuramoyl-L-alanine amidase [Thermonemataceae bacterium]|nr:N-acetylmuramoyl-L-alanine amidase [Thermonemataceae bacterium]